VEVFSTLWPSREQPELLESWLSSSSQLLLKLAQRSHQYEEVLFKDPLSECDFAAVQINTQGTFASSSMLPMFGAAFTQSTQDMSTQGDQASAQAGVRATQDALFSQTQVQDDSDWSRRGNWDASQFGSTQSVGGDLFAPVGATQQAADYSSTQPSQGGGGSQSTSLKKRFQGGVKQRSHIIRALQNKKRREKEFSERSKTMRSKAVQVLREYRQGELPDIQIKRRDILQPLMVVVAGDAEVAGITFGAMFDAIFKAKIFDKELEYGPEDMREEIRQHLTNALGDAKVSYKVTPAYSFESRRRVSWRWGSADYHRKQYRQPSLPRWHFTARKRASSAGSKCW
jgi:DNA-dependent protein kinase catalytic subunit